MLEGKHEMIMKRCMELESSLKVSEDKVVELEGMATASEELIMELKGALLESEEIAKEAGDKCKKLEELAEEEGAAARRLAGLKDEVAMWRERAETFEGVVKAGEACIQELKRLESSAFPYRILHHSQHRTQGGGGGDCILDSVVVLKALLVQAPLEKSDLLSACARS
jgi:chromosome segregation ATPase